MAKRTRRGRVQPACTVMVFMVMVLVVYSSEVMMCACGETGSCGAAGLRCFCDNDDDVWRTDEGDITNRDDLPVKGFCAGDTGQPPRHLYYTLSVIWGYGSHSLCFSHSSLPLPPFLLPPFPIPFPCHFPGRVGQCPQLRESVK